MAEENDSSGGEEKSHDPTPERLAEARRRGDVPRSADAGAAGAWLGLLAAIFAAGPAAVSEAGAALTGLLAAPERLEGLILGPGGPGLLAAMLAEAALPAAPFLWAPALAALLAWVAQGAVAPAGEKLAPKLSRLSPIENAKKKFGLTGIVEFLKATAKLFAVAAVLAAVLAAETERMLGLLALPARPAAAETVAIGLALLPWAAAVAVAVAAFDLVWQRVDHARRLRMSRKELEEERKKAEGDPHLKAERGRRARGIAQNRMLAEVPKADVVIVNPEHYAVALVWSRAPGAAPVCVAKGVDEIALAIRERAAEAGVPIRSDPPTARALHAAVELGEEVRPEHYRPVAAAIRWAEEMRHLARAAGHGAPGAGR